MILHMYYLMRSVQRKRRLTTNLSNASIRSGQIQLQHRCGNANYYGSMKRSLDRSFRHSKQNIYVKI